MAAIDLPSMPGLHCGLERTRWWEIVLTILLKSVD